MKIILVLLCTLLLASCSTKNFYAYEKGKDHCTIEEDKNRYVVYYGT